MWPALHLMKQKHEPPTLRVWGGSRTAEFCRGRKKIPIEVDPGPGVTTVGLSGREEASEAGRRWRKTENLGGGAAAAAEQLVVT